MAKVFKRNYDNEYVVYSSLVPVGKIPFEVGLQYMCNLPDIVRKGISDKRTCSDILKDGRDDVYISIVDLGELNIAIKYCIGATLNQITEIEDNIKKIPRLAEIQRKNQVCRCASKKIDEIDASRHEIPDLKKTLEELKTLESRFRDV